MKLLVAPHDLGIGGSQINAIDLAVAAADAGHEVLVYGVRGPLVERIEAGGLEYVEARPLQYRPAPSRIAQLAALARRRGLDLIHAYEWPPCLDAYYGAHLLGGVPVVCTVLSMEVSPLVPPSIPLVMGTDLLGEQARERHRAPVWVLEPPIDVEADHPGIDGAGFRERWGIGRDAPLVVTVSRLALDLKLDALVGAIDAVDLLAARMPVRLAMVGGGPADAALRERAAAVNRRRGREVVTFTGALADPREAYAAGDVVVGMGSSALRGLAIGRPVVVQGEEGFSKPFTPATLPYFLHSGFWGRAQDGWTPHFLAEQLADLLADPVRRAELGGFGRDTVVERFSIARAAARQMEIYDQVLAGATGARPREGARTAWRALGVEVDNHDPRRKRRRRQDEHARLSAARAVVESAHA
jgi:glycosyltransferase involved in cell wall biosynthesis